MPVRITNTQLPEHPTMRDIHDYCVKHQMPSLAQGMIELPPPLRLRQLAADCLMTESVHTYRNRWGEADYRQGLLKLLKAKFGVEVPVDAILGTQGVTSGMVATLMLLRRKGIRQVGMLVPFYTYHQKDIEATVGIDAPTFIRTNDDFSINLQYIEEAFQGGLRALIVTNPGNPTGIVIPKDTIEQLIDTAAKYKAWLIFDECYCDMVYCDHPYYSPIDGGLRDRVVVCRGFSKCLGIQSWRVGYTVAKPELIVELMGCHDPVYISVPVLQHAMAQYLSDHTEEYIKHSSATAALIERNWKVLSPAFEKALGWTPVQPEGSMYGVFWHNNGTNDMDEAIRALQKGVGVCPGSIFMQKGVGSKFCRIHCGVSEEKADSIVQLLLSASPLTDASSASMTQ